MPVKANICLVIHTGNSLEIQNSMEIESSIENGAFSELQQSLNLSSIVNIEFSCFPGFGPSIRWVTCLEIGSLYFELLKNFAGTQRAAGAQLLPERVGKRGSASLPLLVCLVIPAGSFQIYFHATGK